jgi:hypothetical protein
LATIGRNASFNGRSDGGDCVLAAMGWSSTFKSPLRDDSAEVLHNNCIFYRNTELSCINNEVREEYRRNHERKDVYVLKAEWILETAFDLY